MSSVPGCPRVCLPPTPTFQVHARDSLLPPGRKRSNENLTAVFILCTVKILALPPFVLFMRRRLVGKSEGIKMKETQTHSGGEPLGHGQDGAAGFLGRTGAAGGAIWGVCGRQL